MKKVIAFILLFIICFSPLNVNIVQADSNEIIYLPALMYHKISAKQSLLGRYVVSPRDFESDLILLKEKGYETVTINDLYNFVQNKVPLPEKPVMLTFDDGFESDYVYAFDLLKKHNMKGIFAVVGAYTDKYSQNIDKHINYAHLCWTEIKEMQESGLAEFQSHTYDLHKNGTRRGPLKKSNETDEDYKAFLTEDIKRLNEAFTKNSCEAPTAFVCPFGHYNGILKETLKENGFVAILTSAQKINKLTGDPEELYRLGRIVRTHNTNLETLINEWESEKQLVKQK